MNASLALTVITKLPLGDGVPDSVAVEGLKLIPAGSVPVRLNVTGLVPPGAANVCE